MRLTRTAALALLVVAAGCTGISGEAATTGSTTERPTDPTTELPTAPTSDETSTTAGTHTTESHTAEGTSHVDTHLVVSTSADVDDVRVTLGTGDAAETYPVDGSADLTREIHERGHDVRVLVERGDEQVFNLTIYGYEHYDVRVDENDTSVTHSEV